jgi:6-phospho-beta-glucosidase
MKAMEEVVIEAAVSGDYGKALQAFTINPLVPSGTKAKEMLDVMLVANKNYLPQFKAVIAELEAKGVTYEKK